MERKSFLDTLSERPVIGDGSYVITLEKRGYVRAGAYTPEAALEYPDAGNNAQWLPKVETSLLRFKR